METGIINPAQILFGLTTSACLASLSYRLKALNISGAAGMIIIGTMVFGLGGWEISVPLLFFFISSSLLSRIKNRFKIDSMKLADKTGPRDIRQVFANGGAAALSVLAWAVTQDSIWIYVYIASVCEASADTWATEIGTLSKTKPVSIVSFKEVQPGQSGGVTLIGTAGAVLGSLFTAIVAIPLLAKVNYNFGTIMLISSAGFAGCLFDSLLGATIQRQFCCSKTGKVTENKHSDGIKNSLFRGINYIDNDIVNFSSCIFTAGIIVIVKVIV